MNYDELTPEEQQIVEHIQAVSKLKIDSEIREVIRARIIDEFQTINATRQPHARLIRPRFSRRLAAVSAAALVIVVLAALFASQMGRQSNLEVAQASTATASPAALVMATATTPLTATFDAQTASATHAPTLSVAQATVSSIPPSPTFAQTSTPAVLTATPENLIIVEGPVTAISDNLITVYDFSIEVEPQHPILQLIEVGDVVRAQGVVGSSGDIVASVVSNIPGTPADNVTAVTVGLEGPVEAINGNMITVNGISVQLSPDMPTVQVGDFVSVQGNFENIGTEAVLVVVNVVIVNNVVVDGNPLCWYHDTGMGMGHWHCDGMGMGGMGMGGMGMGQ